MKKIYLSSTLRALINIKSILILVLLITHVKQSFGNWFTVNTLINDNFNAVRFFNANTGIIAGDKGIYYTTTGGITAASWMRYNIFQTTSDSVIYNQTSFEKITLKNNEAYLCGRDTINNNAVIFYLDIFNQVSSLKYTGPAGSKLNDIYFSAAWQQLYAVGDNGFFVRSDLTNYTVLPSGTGSNLNSITYISANGRLMFFGDEVVVYGVENGSSITLTANSLPAQYFTASADYSAFNTYAFGNSFYTVWGNGTSVTSNTNFDFGPLQATRALYHGFRLFVSTSHGIFMSNSGLSVLELQAATGRINDIYFLNSNAPDAYAAGDSGIVLFTWDAGGPTKPFCDFYLSGVCTGDTLNMNGIIGSGTSCKWFVNGVQVSNFCTVNHPFTAPGTYQLSYVVSNAFSSDTSNHTIQIVYAPIINLPVILNDSVLCKQEPISLLIDSSQNDFSYYLWKNITSYGSVNGNGAQVLLNTVPLDSGGVYHIKAYSNLAAGCRKAFTDSILLRVEHTKAIIHPSLINAIAGEQIQFYSNSIDAQHFSWTFSNSGNNLYSLQQNPDSISFADTGFIVTKLIAWSNNLCYDSVLTNTTYICNDPLTDDTCWADNTDGIDPPWTFTPLSVVKSLIINRSGNMIMCGGYQQHLFRSRYGQTYGRMPSAGGYVAEYSKNGTLKWMVYSMHHNHQLNSTNYAGFYDVAQDDAKNYYAIYNSYDYGSTFHFNDGDTLISNTYGGGIIKLDSLGKFQWIGKLGAFPFKIKTDHAGNIVVEGEFVDSLIYEKNGVSTNLITAPTSATVTDCSFILKLDPAGNVIWATYFSNYWYHYYPGITDFTIDPFDNIVITGEYQISTKLYSVGNPNPVALTDTNQGFNNKSIYVVKYNSAGALQWAAKARTGDPVDHSVNSYCIRTDDAGSVYVSGLSDGSFNGLALYLNDSANITHAVNIGTYYLIKFTAGGIYRWVAGSINPGWVYSSAIAIDGNRVLNTFSSGPNNQNAVIISADSTTTPINFNNTDFIIADFDTSGRLQWMGNAGSYDRPIYPKLMQVDANGYIYVAGEFHTNDSTTLFGNTIYLHGIDCFYAKAGVMPCSDSLLFTGVSQILHSDPNNSELILWPNPSTGKEIRLRAKNFGEQDNIEITIYDALGNRLFNTHQRWSKVIDLTGKALPQTQGIYFLEMNNGKRSVSQKFVINK